MLAAPLLSAGLIGALFLFIDPGEVWERFSALPPWSMLLAIVIGWLNIAGSALRYRLVLRDYLDGRPSFFQVYRFSFLCAFVNNIAPMAALAETVRMAAAWRLMRLAPKKAIESIVQDRATALIALVLVAVAFLPVQAIYLPDGDVVWYQALVLLVVLGVAAVLLPVARLPLLQRIPGVALVTRAALRFYAQATSRGTAVTQILYGGLICLTLALRIWLFALILGLDVTLAMAMAFAPIIYVFPMLPFLYVGFGAREVAMVATLGATGLVASPDAMAISLAVSISHLVATIPGGVLWWWDVRRPEVPK